MNLMRNQMECEVALLENNLDCVFCFLIINSVHLVVKFSFQSIKLLTETTPKVAMLFYEPFENIYRSSVASG